MTAVTLHFEDKFFVHLKESADRVGYSIDNYILHVLSKNYKRADEDEKQNDVDALLGSMQFQGVSIPVDENGKGALAQTKYL